MKRIISFLTSAVLAITMMSGTISASAEVKNENQTSMENDISISGANSFGNLIADEFSQVYEEQLNGNGCSVQSIEMNGNVAEVKFSTAYDATLIVGIYDEDGEQLLSSEKVDINTTDVGATVPIKMAVMPEYYCIKAYLVDRIGLNPLSTVYENKNYTQKMQEFLSKTTDDFDEERVLNFDDDKTTNFAVYSESTRIIPSTEEVNILKSADEENGIYIFENIDENISSLETDDIFSYDYNAEVPLIIKVGTIKISGTTAEIHCAKTDIDEVFEHFRIEQNTDLSSASIDNSTVDPRLEYLGIEEPSENLSDNQRMLPAKLSINSDKKDNNQSGQSSEDDEEKPYTHELDIKWNDDRLTISDKQHLKFTFNDELPEEKANSLPEKERKYMEKKKKDPLDITLSVDTKLEGSLDFSTTLSLVLYAGDKADNYMEASFEFEFTPELEVSAKLEYKIPLVHLKWVLSGGVVVDITPSFVVKASGSVSINAKFSTKLGFRITDTNHGIKYDDISENPTLSAGVKIEGEFFVGLSLEPKIKVLADWIANVKATAEAGIKIKATLEYEDKIEIGKDKNETEKHDCTSCILGETSFDVTVKLSGEIFKENLMNITILDISVPLHEFDFYVSLDHDDEFGFGSCPYRSYKVDFNVSDQITNQILEGAEVTVTNEYKTKSGKVMKDELTSETDKDGNVSFFLHEGKNEVTVKMNKFSDNTATLNVKVKTDYKSNKDGKEKLVRTLFIDKKETTSYDIEMMRVSYPVHVTVIDDAGDPVALMAVENNNPYIKTKPITTYLNGSCTVPLPDGTWEISTSETAEYESNSAKVTVEENSDDIYLEIVVKHKKALSKFTVHDQFGDPVVGAKVKIENIDQSELALIIPTTDSDGLYSRRLEEGNYKITISKDGYDTVTDNFIVENTQDGVALEYEMQSNLVPVNVTVVDENGSAISDALVSSNYDTVTYKTGSDGHSLIKLPVGDYTVSASRDGYSKASASVSVVDGEENSVEITLGKAKSCGNNVYWEFDEDTGVLRIYGNGDMWDYKDVDDFYHYITSRAPWYRHEYLFKKVVIEDGITSIGNYAFYECTQLIEITIPDSVTSIGEYAFYGCTGLTGITISDSVTSIEIPEGITSVGESAFEGCTGLTSITIPNNVTSIGNYAFYKCTQLTEITIPDSVTSIGYDAFKNCTGLTEITMPNSLTSIGIRAFSGCTGLTEIIIPDSVTSIGGGAFSGCTLTEITIPDSVKWVDGSPFNGCSTKTLIIAEGSETITNVMTDFSFEEIIIPDSVTSIGNNTFWRNNRLTKITIPDSVTSIGSGAFNNCKNLTEITISDSVTSIEDTPFYGCSIKTLIIADGSETITNAIKRIITGNTESIEKVIIPDSVTSIEFNSFEGCTGLKEITIPDSVTSIKYNAFGGCTGLTEIIIPDSVTSIESRAFSGCTGLTSITIPNSVTSIENGAFSGCSGLTEITIPDSVTTIGNYAFYGCTGLTEITILDSVTSIGNSAFKGCTGLTSVTIPNSVTNIGNSAFSDCTDLIIITIPGSVTIEEDEYGMKNVFGSSKKNSTLIIAEESKEINFEGLGLYRNSIKKVIIPKSVTFIFNYSFEYFSNLTDVYYSGSEEEWSKILMGHQNKYLKNATIHYNSTGVVPTPSPAPPVMKLNNVSVLAEEPTEEAIEEMTEEPAVEITAKTAEFTDLKPNTVYNFYSMKSREAEDPLSSENLLYISQEVSDENGNLSISYIPKEEAEESEEFVVNMIYNIGCAEVTVDNLDYTGEEITPTFTVKHNGNLLAEGTDYQLSVPENPVEQGNYTAIISGLGDYYGDKIVSFKVVCKHEYSDGVCSICGTTCSHVYENGVCTNCGQTEPVVTTTTTSTTTSATTKLTTTTSATTTNITTTANTSTTITKQTTMTDASTTPPTTTDSIEPIFNLGDVNNDGMVDSSDASTVLIAYAMLSTGKVPDLTEEQLKTADLNLDGTVDSSDASLILSYYSYVSTGGENSVEIFLKEQYGVG